MGRRRYVRRRNATSSSNKCDWVPYAIGVAAAAGGAYMLYRGLESDENTVSRLDKEIAEMQKKRDAAADRDRAAKAKAAPAAVPAAPAAKEAGFYDPFSYSYEPYYYDYSYW